MLVVPLRRALVPSLALALALLSSLASAQAEAPAAVALRYTHGSTLAGEAAVDCHAAAILLPEGPGRLDVRADHARLHTIHTWLNTTTALSDAGLPLVVESTVEQTRSSVDLGSTLVAVRWSERGDAALVEPRVVLPGTAGSLHAAFTAHEVQIPPPAPVTALAPIWVDHGSGPALAPEPVPGWTRSLGAVGGPFAITGDAVLLLHDASIQGERSAWESGPAREARRTSLVGAEQESVLVRDAAIEMRGASITVATAASPVCRALSLDLDGTFTAHGATGHVGRGPDQLAVEGRSITLEGRMRLRERPAPEASHETVEAEGEGEFTALGVDFAPAGPRSLVAASAPIALAAAGAALAGAAAWKVATGFFTRLRTDAVLDLQTRRRVHEAIQQNPGATLESLGSILAIGHSTARYHARVLRRHGHIRAEKMQRAWRFFPLGGAASDAREQVRLGLDAPLQILLGALGPQPVPAAGAVAALQSGAGLSRSGAWKVVDRAAEARLVLKVKDQGRLLLCRAS